MGVYRDSQLGLCIDLRGPDGNVFYLLGVGNDLARQLGQTEEWRETIEAATIMEANYETMVNIFRDFFPIITFIGLEDVCDVQEDD